jgi:hypothetical protein
VIGPKNCATNCATNGAKHIPTRQDLPGLWLLPG